jgi:hypothetical protein
MKNYLKRTWKNKIAALAMAAVGYATTMVAGDGTAFAFILMIAIPMFFMRENVFEG